MLKSKLLKSILIELDETRSDYQASLEIIKKNGFKLIEKVNAEYTEGFTTVYNHIFFR